MLRRMLMPALVLLSMYALCQGDVVTFSDGFETYADGTISPAPNWLGYQMGGVTAKCYNFVDTDSQGIAHSGAKVYHVYRDTPSVGVGASLNLTTTASANIRYDGNDGVYVYTGWAYLGNKNTSGGDISMSSKLVFQTLDSSDNMGTYVGFQLDGHSNSPRYVNYYDGEDLQTVEIISATLPVDTWLKVLTTVDEINDEWSFEITTAAGADVYSASDLSYHSSSFTQLDKARVYFQTNNTNDGFNNRIDDISVTYVPEPATMSLLMLGGLSLLLKRK